ncbi:MAG: hypothetical protein F6J95_005405 [Leptolyngbya sp. SIO1E4]|nr:hypothetical protein [Leptolyngbya sp. SIO1E4]
MFHHLSKSRAGILLISGLIGSVALGSYFLSNPLGLRAIAQETRPSQPNAAELVSLSQWLEAGSHPEDYAMGADLTLAYRGSASGTVRAQTPEVEGFGTLMQVFDASAYQGQRLRLQT